MPITTLDEDAQRRIHASACNIITAAVAKRQGIAIPNVDPAQQLGEIANQHVHGVYVTLKRGQALRGCCGFIGSPTALLPGMSDAGRRTTIDPRMSPIDIDELPHLNLSVSLLGNAERIPTAAANRDEGIQIGIHGIRMRLGNHSGLLLPSVATERNWNARQFLDALCRKSGVAPGAWMRNDAQVLRFPGVHFGEGFIIDAAAQNAGEAFQDGIPAASLREIRSWIDGNLVTLLAGGTPAYYANGLDDTEVHGCILQLIDESGKSLNASLRFGIKDRMPMQATLFQLTQNMAAWISSRRNDAAVAPMIQRGQFSLRVAVLQRPIHLGALTEYDFGGVSSTRRAVMLTDGSRWSVEYDRGGHPQALLQACRSTESFVQDVTQVYAVQFDTLDDRVSVSVGPRASSGAAIRPPAVAGRFYPADDALRSQMVDKLIAAATDTPSTLPVAAPVVMVPHAGLRFSGRIAAAVWRRTHIPDSVVILSPKHTAEGVDCAVCPAQTWQLSATTRMNGNPQMARSLCESVTALQLDASAHRGEHGIEVQLPLLHRIAPQARVVGITIGNIARDIIWNMADEIAAWIQRQPVAPLLAISSDMNHYAQDSDNRRRDRLALDAIQTGDPNKLLDVCVANSISMCGRLPAALVMRVLQQLRSPAKPLEIGYATSGDAGGDRTRVVGYAGVLWNTES
ncbi:MAG: AmmeMemoRadiSam system protein B [Planctomycetota bacterium]